MLACPFVQALFAIEKTQTAAACSWSNGCCHRHPSVPACSKHPHTDNSKATVKPVMHKKEHSSCKMGAPPVRQSYPAAQPFGQPPGACLELWPPRSAADVEHIATDKLARCLSVRLDAGKQSFNISFEPPCTLRAEFKAPAGPCISPAAQFASPATFNLCTLVHTARQLRQNPYACSQGYDRSHALFWDAAPLPSFWQNTSTAAPCRNLVSTFDQLARTASSKVKRASARPFPKFKSCAVVGGAPTLRKRALGETIDAHEAVREPSLLSPRPCLYFSPAPDPGLPIQRPSLWRELGPRCGCKAHSACVAGRDQLYVWPP